MPIERFDFGLYNSPEFENKWHTHNAFLFYRRNEKNITFDVVVYF